MTPSTDDSDASAKLYLTVAEAARLIGIGEKHLRSILKNVPTFPRVQVSPHRVLIPRGLMLQHLGAMPRGGLAQ